MKMGVTKGKKMKREGYNEKERGGKDRKVRMAETE